METLLFISTITALMGAYLNSNGNYLGFYLWLVSNSIFSYHNFCIAEYSQCALFSVYFLISINGIRNHEKF